MIATSHDITPFNVGLDASIVLLHFEALLFLVRDSNMSLHVNTLPLT